VKIATAADFEGNRWTVNAVLVPEPRGACFLMPVASVARLFKKHNGTQAVAVKAAPSSLDIAASRTAGKIYLHVANLEYRQTVEAAFAVAGMAITGGRVIEIAPEDLRQYVNQDQPDVFQPRTTEFPSGAPPKWRFQAGSVAAVELDIAQA